MNKYYVFYKPFGYLSQFTDEGNNPGLAKLIQLEKDVYPVGRLDKDSEGLLLITNDKLLNNKLLNPNNKHNRTYYAQVEGNIDKQSITQLEKGVNIKVGKKRYDTLPAQVRSIDEPQLPERNPPIRFRKSVPTSWIELKLIEGKNRQVRKMCAAVGYPCLRLVRVGIEEMRLEDLDVGELKSVESKQIIRLLKL
ncbi:MAG: pseudouridine synthase [Crocinitomicaceae bacterium]|nr:pseudouridine synthase [Crocinitomicaceae bacterium]|tara:strand:- start:6627 stop:7208 length:582 start_codon:yes stop_codon:yes gene_type:complete